MPSGSFTRAVLLNGLDAPTGGQAQKDPQPVLLRLIDHAILPNEFRFAVKECFIVGAGYGDISSERAYIRTEALSCITNSGQAVDVPVKGYVTGEDGKAGMRGRLVSKQGQLLANALIAGVASGIGHAFQQNATTFSVSPLGSTATVNQSEQLTAGIGTGVGRALDRLAQYYITLAEKVFPVIEVDAGRAVDVVITKGAALDGFDQSAEAAFPHWRIVTAFLTGGPMLWTKKRCWLSGLMAATFIVSAGTTQAADSPATALDKRLRELYPNTQFSHGD